MILTLTLVYERLQVTISVISTFDCQKILVYLMKEAYLAQRTNTTLNTQCYSGETSDVLILLFKGGNDVLIYVFHSKLKSFLYVIVGKI
jgi:hypothetical protein